MAADQGSSSRAILYALLANFGIAITKSGAAAYTNSGSMLAEAIHSYADCANQLLLFLGLKQADKPATRDSPTRLRQDHLFLELRRRTAAVQHGRPVLDL